MQLKAAHASRLLTLFSAFALLLPDHSVLAGAASLESIHVKVAQFLKRPGLRSADWGIEIVDPSTEMVLLSVNPDKPFQPASVVKVITAATALEKLGPNFKFKTGLYTNGTLHPDGTLEGDLILVGRGDPNLADPEGEILAKPALVELREKLQALGVKKIRGDVVGDDSYFDGVTHGKGWTEHDLKTPSGVPVCALSINDNVVWIHLRPTKVNQRVTVGIEPRSSYFRIRNLGITGGPKSTRTIYARLIPGTQTVVVSGVLPSAQGGFGQHLILDRPAEVVAGVLKDELVRNGIEVSGDITVIHRGDLPNELRRRWRLLAEHESPPLVRALEVMNKKSKNLHAEMLLRTLGAEFGAAGSDDEGLQIVKRFLLEAGIDNSHISLTDGSGLSRDNLLTPRFQTSLMTYLSTRPYFELFLNTLAVNGTDGTLKNRLAAQPVRGMIHAKTGTLNGASSLSGYMTTRSGRNLVFSIFANNFRASATRVRRTIDEICALFVNFY